MTPIDTGIDQAAAIAAGLERAGFKVRRPGRADGWYSSTTALCHGGDNIEGLGWRNDGKGGIVATCFTGGCRTETAAPALRLAAGVARSYGDDYRPPPPAPPLPPEPRRLDAAPTRAGLPPPAMLAVYARGQGWPTEPPPVLHPYRWPDGSTALVVVRFATPQGKRARRISWGMRNGRARWQWGGTENAAVPLYRLPELLERPTVPVLILEGEKTADAAAALFPQYAATAPLGGSSPADGTDWRPLRGRRILISGDADPAGGKFQDRVSAAAWRAGASAVGIARPSRLWQLLGGLGSPPPGWDVADGITDCRCGADGMLTVAARLALQGKPERAIYFVNAAADASLLCENPETHLDRITAAYGALP